MTDVAALPAAEPPTGGLVGEWTLRVALDSAGLARRLVSQALAAESEPLRRKAVLVTSELVANGVRHARGVLVLRLHRPATGWLLSVGDGSAAPPHLRTDVHLSEQGRGLMIIARTSRDVGWVRTPTGKIVWAHLTDSDG